MSTNTSGSTEPKGSGGSSLDDTCATCGHARRHHYGSGAECAACERNWRHSFVPADAETADCDVQWHVHTGGPTDRPLDTCRSDAETAGECEHIREGGCCSGPGYCAHACREAAPEPGTAGEPEALASQNMCACGYKPSEGGSHAASCFAAPRRPPLTPDPGCVVHGRTSAEAPSEPETPEEPTLASALKRVEALERPDPDCIRPTGCRDKLKRGCAHGCAEAADDVTRLGEEMEPEAPECTCSKEPWRYDDPPPGPDIDCPVHGELRFLAPPRRPPYAVAYAVEGGAQYEVALPGDATVRAVDGALLITHSRPVLALTIVRPMGAEEGA